MSDEEQGPFGMDDEDEDEYTVVQFSDPDVSGRKHGRWTILAEVLDCASGVSVAFAELFINLARAAQQHGLKDVATREFHEAVAQELERLPVIEDKPDA